MYDLTTELTLKDEINLEYGCRYDFIRFLREERVEDDPLNGAVFVFRKETRDNTNQRILIDLIDSRSVNAFDVALHNNAHIHIIELDEMFDKLDYEGLAKRELTEDIDIMLIQNDSSVECHALIKHQQYKRRIKNGEPIDVYFEELKYLLYTEYNSDVINMNQRILSPIFSLQEEYHFVNAQYKEIARLMSISNLLPLQRDASWLENQMKIKEKKEKLKKDKESIKNKILDTISEQTYIP